MQPTHATSDKTMAEDRIGKDRMPGLMPGKKVLDSGNIISEVPMRRLNW